MSLLGGVRFFSARAAARVNEAQRRGIAEGSARSASLARISISRRSRCAWNTFPMASAAASTTGLRRSGRGPAPQLRNHRLPTGYTHSIQREPGQSLAVHQLACAAASLRCPKSNCD